MQLRDRTNTSIVINQTAMVNSGAAPALSAVIDAVPWTRRVQPFQQAAWSVDSRYER